MNFAAFATMENYQGPEQDEHELPQLIAEDVVQLDEQVSDIENLNNSTDQAIGHVDRLAETCDILINDDGLHISDSALKSIQATHESIARHLGFDDVKFSVATFESIAGNNRSAQIVATLEGLISTLSKNIVLAMKRLAERISEFIQGLLRSNWLLNRYYESIAKKVNALSANAEPKQLTMDESKSIILLESGESGLTAAKILVASAQGLVQKAQECANLFDETNFKTSGGSDEFNPFEYIPKRGERSLIKGREIRPPFGSVALDYFAVLPFAGTVPNKIEVLSPRDMRELLSGTKHLIDNIKKFDKAQNKLKRFIASIALYTGQAITGGLPSLVSNEVKKINNNLNVLATNRSYLNRVMTRYPLEAYKTAKAVLNYIQHSLKHYSGD